MLYFLAVAVGIGFGMNIFLPKVFKGVDILTSFNGIILYYFAFDFVMRLQLQELPTLSIIPYLHLKVPKYKIIGFLNIKALFSAFNLWPIFLFFPFIFTEIIDEYGAFAAVMYVVAILSITVFNNYLILYIKRKSITNVLYTLGGFILIAIFGALEYFKIISLISVSDTVFRAIGERPYLGFAFTILAFAVFKINSDFLLKNLYA
ncbi:MAG: hypothetical protein EOO95_10960, partial [Pedobacter sp.]